MIIHRSWRKCTETRGGATWIGQGKVQAEKVMGPGAHVFTRDQGKSIWDSHTKVRLVNSKRAEVW